MTISKVDITPYRLEDLQQIVSIEKETFSMPWTEEMFRQEAESLLSHIWVARAVEKTGELMVLGYLIYWLIAGECHLQKIAVRLCARRQGIASNLIACMLSEARASKCHSATLEVRKSNQEAIRLYTRYGFSIEGVRPHYYDDTGEDALILWAELPNLSRIAFSRKGRLHVE